MHLVSELAGATLAGRYRLEGSVAGGTGDIYLGHDALLERPVAVRVLRSGRSDDSIEELWLVQASAAARLSHPHTVTIFDWGCEDDGTCFMVMEHVPGVDLRDVLVTRGILDAPSAAEIMLAVCDGLSAAHSLGIVHGAIRPESILIARDGTVKLTDFGLVPPGSRGGRHDIAGLTAGSRYLAPEQGAGRPATLASDIWTTGAVLAEALSGRPPTSENVVPPSKHIRKVPRALDDIVRRACAPDPHERWHQVSDMAFALQRSLAASRRPPDPVENLVDEVSGGEEVPDIEAPRRPTRQDLDTQRKSRRLLLGVIALIVALVAGRALASVVLPQDVDVPELVGLTREVAVERAEAAGLGARVEDRRRDRNAPRGVVLSQDQSGALKEDSMVGLVVSAGPPRVKVPLLLGLNLDDAQVQMDKFDMEPSSLSERYSAEPDGDIIEQAPAAGQKRAWGSAIELVLSKGPAPTEIPSPDGGIEGARLELKRAGFVPVLQEAYSDDVDEGGLVEITPAPGTVAAFGSEVQIVVSAGPEFPELTVPDVRDLEVDPARDKLERAGFQVDVLEICDGGAKVVDSDPAGGATSKKGDLVTLLVC
ncbi:MAG: PASTA domain-containing protein [Actinomycetota bacterium]|nr:PASTA domain-containing protein [Actinomycetota bacterium]